MTTKEKAVQLFDRFDESIRKTTHHLLDCVDSPSEDRVLTETAKQCALIAVDEMLNVCDWKTKPYLIEVKQEIEKLKQ